MNFKKLIEIQTVFNARIKTVQTIQQYHFALNVELGEFFNTLPWKWWKKVQPIDRHKILDELADVMAFLFSVYDVHFNINVKEARIGDEQKADIIKRSMEHLEEGFEQGLQEDPKILNIYYWPNSDIPALESNGIKLGQLVALAQMYTGCTLKEVENAYLNKMNINHARQNKNY